MNTLELLGQYFAVSPINGLPYNSNFNGPFATSLGLSNSNARAGSELISHLCQRIEIETFHAERVAGKDKHLIKEARFYFFDNEEPLCLRPIALKDKHYPEQLFDIDTSTGDVTVKNNNYFPDMTIEETLTCVANFFVYLVSFTGKNAERNIKVFSYDIPSGNFESQYGLHLNEKYINLIERSVDEKATACRREFVDSFLKEFTPGMANKASIALSQSMEMEAKPWSQEELKKPLLETLKCTSMESKTTPFKAYISHDERLEKYIEQYLIRNFPIQPPFIQEEHGLNADTWDAFFATGESFAYKNRYINFLKGELDKRALTLGDAIAVAGV